MDKQQQLEQEVAYLKQRLSDLEKEIDQMPTENERSEKTERQEFRQDPDNFIPEISEKRKVPAIEQVIGQYVMPITATFLILLGSGIFAFLVWNDISNFLKAGFLVLLALIFFGISFVMGKEEKVIQGTLISLGLLILYSDLIAMTFSWHLCNSIVFLIFLLLWCLCGIFFSFQLQTKFLYWILQLGLILTAILSSEANIINVTIFLPYLLSVISYQKEYSEGNFCFGISFWFFLLAFAFSIRELSLWPELVLLALGLAFTWFYPEILFSEKDKASDKITFSKVIMGILALTVPFFFYGISDRIILVSIVGILFELFVLYRNSAFLPCAFLPLLYTAEALSEQFGLELLGCAVILFGIFLFFLQTKRKSAWTCLILSDFCFAFLLLLSGWIFPDFETLSKNIPFLFLNLIMLLYGAKESSIRFTPFVCLTINLFTFLARMDHPIIFSFLILELFSGIYFFSEVENEEKKFSLFSFIPFPFLILIYGNIYQTFSVVMMSLALLWYLAFMIFQFSQVKQKQSTSAWYDFAFSFLFTLLFYFLITEHTGILGKAPVIVSLCFMILASVFLFVGSKSNQKTLRMYGFALLFLSILKMVLWDLSGSVFIRVIALILGGVICLGIAFLYNRKE